MKFDYAIGNPPYQEDRQGESKTALPVYHHFMEAAYSVSNAVELITPARFLFDAGRTPKKWNEKMLNDEHFKVLQYEGDGQKIFPTTEIKGGVAITYRDIKKNFEPIGTFTVYPELNKILSRVKPFVDSSPSLAEISFVATKFSIDNLVVDFPKYTKHERRMSSNVLEFECFNASKKNDSDIGIYGIYEGKRNIRYIAEKYVVLSDKAIRLYKIVLPKADGNGTFGDTLTNPEVLGINMGFTHTFLGIGGFRTREEAENLNKYIKTRFARTLLGILKVTQDMNADKWKYVPLQDFTPNSDINWSASIHDIDQQLYKKYGLSQQEIDFIESHVKEMA